MSHPALAATDDAFARALADTVRGPQRDGVFALWLVVRAALAAAPPAPPPARHADRLRAVAARIRSLNAPAPLRRSLVAAIADLGAPRAPAAATVLAALASPAAECLGRPAADAVQAAARAARVAAR
ncbi:MAG TPA: hypothetical protein VEH83_11815 [Gemmatimonadales bacterium]|nr:hypothetical protein [Gemmatimonadales bacterium]